MLSSASDYAGLYKWENLKNFQDRWDLGAPDLAGMYEASLTSQISQRLWGGSRHSAKSAMSAMIQANPSFARLMFDNLFDERKDLVLRMQRFRSHCDELLMQLPRARKVNDHFHGDHRMTSLYLAFRYPTRYAILQFDALEKSLSLLGMQKPPTRHELERCFKLLRALDINLRRDEELRHLERTLLTSKPIYHQATTLMLVYDFYTWLAGTEPA